MAGYFRVSMGAARAIAEASDGPDLLAAYIVLAAFAFGEKREQTAAGAQAIRKALGCSDYHSKALLAELLEFPQGKGAGQVVLAPSGRRKANAAIYQLPTWEGDQAYPPALLVDTQQRHAIGLQALLDLRQPPRVIADALLLLLHAYAVVDYAGWCGCPPGAMPWYEWRREGTAYDDFPLGFQGEMGGQDLWLVAGDEGAEWSVDPQLVDCLYGPQAAAERLWQAWECLLQCGLLVRVVSVQVGRWTYPLWIASPELRERLNRDHDIVTDLGRRVHTAACRTGWDPDAVTMNFAMSLSAPAGSGLFFCLGHDPVVRSLVMPRLHAPTPVNLDGLKHLADITDARAQEVDGCRWWESVHQEAG